MRNRNLDLVHISTTIDRNLLIKCREQHINISQLIVDGWNAHKGMAGTIDRVNEMEVKIERMARLLETTQREREILLRERQQMIYDKDHR